MPRLAETSDLPMPPLPPPTAITRRARALRVRPGGRFSFSRPPCGNSMTLSATRGFTRSILIANRGLRHETIGPFDGRSLLDDDLAGAGAAARTCTERDHHP